MSHLRGDARKRLTSHAEHPDPTVCQLIRGARAVTLNDCAHTLRNGVDTAFIGKQSPEFIAGWNAAVTYHAAVFTTAATEIQATP